MTYFDLRSAETAKDALQSYRINGRELDVHYSLPRESELSKRCDRDKDQGTLLVFDNDTRKAAGREEGLTIPVSSGIGELEYGQQ